LFYEKRQSTSGRKRFSVIVARVYHWNRSGRNIS